MWSRVIIPLRLNMQSRKPSWLVIGRDLGLIMFSILVAVWLVDSGVVRDFMNTAGDGWLASLLSGIFFTSAFTTAPAIAALGEVARNGFHPLAVAAVGSLGAMTGDFIIFYFVRDKFAETLGWLVRLPRRSRLRALFKSPLARWSLFIIGALIIASPLPDEMGLALMGLSHVRNRYFIVVSYISNFIGIWIVASIARTL